MRIGIIGAALLLAASGTALAGPSAPGAKPAADKMEANSDRPSAASACSGPSCAPATANHAINEKGTPGTACPKPTAPPPSSGGGCTNPCTCPPPN